jgi:hypothetical protein
MGKVRQEIFGLGPTNRAAVPHRGTHLQCQAAARIMNHKSNAQGIMAAPNCQFSIFPLTVRLSPIRLVMKPLSRSSEVKDEMLETIKKAAISNPLL